MSTRHIALEGAVNFRDLGGYPAGGDSHTRWRTVFRADSMSRLTESDVDVIRGLGIKTVLDLRSPYELEGGSFPVAEIPVEYHHLPFVEQLDHPEKFDLTPGLLASQYLDMLDHAAGAIATSLHTIAASANHPVLVHCTAGKDRTGVLVAVLLRLLDVPDPVIVEDYALSSAAMEQLRRKLIERYPEGREIIEKADGIFSAIPSNIAGLLAHLDVTYGSAADYVRSIGLDDADIARLRTGLLEGST